MPWDDPSLAGKTPVESSSTLSEEQQVALLQRLHAAEKRARCTSYFGTSWCRVCGISNGSLEYTLEGWTWPSGYGHYVDTHGVEMDPEFRAWLETQ